MLEIATGWDKAYMTENPDQVVDVLTKIKINSHALGSYAGWCRITEIMEYKNE
jgi:hypothetical protein